MPENFNWEYQHVKREKNKGRAMGGIITGIKKNREENEEEVNRTTLKEI